MNGRDLKQRLEAALVWCLYQLVAALPLDWASALIGALARGIGPRLGISRRARGNLARAFPDLSAARREEILRGMWENLGRTAGEFPHVLRMDFGDRSRFTIIDGEILRQLQDDGQPGLLFAGHLANWEIMLPIAQHCGLPMHGVYRAANNPHMAWLYRAARDCGTEMIPKGAAGARRALQLLQKGEHLGLMVDQKMNDGIAVPFFGELAMTAPALASFALKYRCPVVPAQLIRGQGARFTLKIYPPLSLPDSGNRTADIQTVMTIVNQYLERWIRENPEQWLWLHRRWPDTPLS